MEFLLLFMSFFGFVGSASTLASHSPSPVVHNVENGRNPADKLGTVGKTDIIIIFDDTLFRPTAEK